MLNKIYIILFLCVSIANAQNPYEQFGFDNSELELEMEKLKLSNFILFNSDTASEVSALKFDFNVGKVVILLKNGNSFEKLIPENMVLRRWSVDPKTDEFPFQSPYNVMSNNPINRIDPDGQADYYAKDGSHIGNDGIDDKRTILGKQSDYTVKDGIITSMSVYAEFTDLNIDHDVFLGLAAAIHKETGTKKSKDEAMAIGNAILNIANQGAGELKTLDDLVMFDNSVVQGATQNNYKEFVKKNKEQQNSKHALNSAINAIGYNNNLLGFSDYSGGADGWDGLDLIFSNHSNSHRSYIWTVDSKTVIEKYIKDNNGNVKLSSFTFKDQGSVIEAKKILGQTLFQNITTPLGGEFQGTKSKFKP